MDRLKRELSLAAVAFALASAAAGCGGAAPPGRLFDGSSSLKPPETLGGVGGPLVMTRVRVVAAAALGSSLKACFKQFGSDLSSAPAASAVVERVGVKGRSLSFRVGRGLYGCDRSTGSADHEARTWCGAGFWGFPSGPRLLDPRLDISCADRKGRLVGFGWFEPLRGARWLTVEEPGYTEVYEVAGGLAVRLVSSDVRVAESAAVFRITQYAADGTRLARNVVEARVAG